MAGTSNAADLERLLTKRGRQLPPSYLPLSGGIQG